ncbi:MAG: sugar diacid recognition domain-containing protein [Flaviflexus sp.]|uniref:CdaR family transcriptional regulator n=1 Tax=Flaviflexus sp. TaxID=1969482 RepID=UPI00352C3F3A
MQISLENAQRIVTEISDVLGEDVNLMDQSAIIIASTDPNRVGNHHLGAERIVVEELDRLIIRPTDKIPGVRPGLNLPIWVEGRIAGVLGITGNPATFTTPAHVLQKMTEILLRETLSRERAQRHGRSYTRFLQAWLRDAREVTRELVTEGGDFDIDVRSHYIVATAQVLHRSPMGAHTMIATRQAEVDRISELATERARRLGATTALLDSRIVMLFPCTDDTTNQQSGSTHEHETNESFDSDGFLTAIVEGLENTAEHVRSTSPMRLVVGISSGDAPAPEAMSQAERALSYGTRSAVDVHRYDQLTLEILLASIPERERLSFISRVFGGIPAESRDDTLRSLQAYFDTNGALSHAAQLLFIHKNTLTGRLNKLTELTGLDPRRTSDASILWLALHLTQDSTGEPQPLA